MTKNFSLKDCIEIELPTFMDERGSLTLLDADVVESRLPFKPKRVFWIHHTPANAVRGNHAHRICWELVVAASGSFDLTLQDAHDNRKFHLDSPTRGVLIPPMIWCKLENFAKHTVCLTLASDDYDARGYINDLPSYLAESRASES